MMPAIPSLNRGKNPRFETWKISEDEMSAFVPWMKGIGGSGKNALKYILKTSYPEALQPKGDVCTVLAIKDRQTNDFAGMVTLAIKQLYIDGTKRRIAYISDLYIAPSYRSRIVPGLIARALRHFTMDCTGWITTVLNDNTSALELLLNSKRRFLRFHDYGLINTLIFKPGKIRDCISGYEIVPSVTSESQLSDFLEFRARQSSKHQFFPHYTLEQLQSEVGVLRDLKPEHLLLVKKHAEIVGSLALWDQSRIKSWVFSQYSTWFRFLRPWLNLGAFLKGIPGLPKCNEEIPYKIIALLSVKDNNAEIFRTLLYGLKEKMAKEGDKSLLALALHQSNPLMKAVDFPYYSIRSKLLFLPQTPLLPDRDIPPYIELGTL